MCGIVYKRSFSNTDVTLDILKQFNEQRMRGTTSFGYYLPEKDRLVHNLHEGRIKNLLKRTKGENHEVLFHHRFSTSTIDCRSACHPFSTKDHFKDQYIGVHNGVLFNDDALKKEHEKLGITYVSLQPDGTFNDSEALIYDLARFMEGQTDKVKATGSVAFIMVKRHNGKAVSVLFGRNYGSPLKLCKDRKGITLSSEGKGIDVQVNTLYEFNYATKKMTTKPMEIGSGWASSTYTTYGGYGIYGSPYSGGVTYSDSRDHIYMRSGTEVQLAHDFLREGGYSPYHASTLAESERQEVCMEASSIKYLIDCESEGYDLDDLLEYWVELEEYNNLLERVADKLYGQKELRGAYEY